MNSLEQRIKELKQTFEKELHGATTKQQLEDVRIKFLSRHGLVATLLDELKKLSVDERRVYGPSLNALKSEVTATFEQKLKSLESVAEEYAALKEKNFDVTAYKPGQLKGSLHPYTHVIQEIEDVFVSMG